MSKVISIRINKEIERRIQYIKDYYEKDYPEFGVITTTDIIKYSIMSYYQTIKEIKLTKYNENEVQ